MIAKTFLPKIRKRNIMSPEQLLSYGFLEKFGSYIVIKDQDTDPYHI